MENLGVFIASILLFPALAQAQLPNGACSYEDVTCAITGDNLVGLVEGVSSAEECRLICEETTDSCEFYSYFGPTSFPFTDSCLLFNNCTDLNPCTDCTTEDIECFFCAAPIEGHLGENLIEIWDDVEDEGLCEERCRSTSGCNFYTYHRLNSTLFPSTCFLLADLEEPVVPCNGGTCSSGSPDCKNTLCSFFDEEGILYTNGLVVTETTDFGMVRIGPCPTTVLVVAVGAGGGCGFQGGSNERYHSGGGSGYIQQAELSGAYLPYSYLQVTIGEAGSSSSVSDGSVNVVSAEGGDYGYSFDGGSGYSGGGAGGYSSDIAGAGGSEGNDGEDGRGKGGTGNGFDVSTIPLKGFTITPGSGGVAETIADGYGYTNGGGGGGILIDGTGPGGGNAQHGEGYGAGAGGKDDNGFDGVVILEFI